MAVIYRDYSGRLPGRAQGQSDKPNEQAATDWRGERYQHSAARRNGSDNRNHFPGRRVLLGLPVIRKTNWQILRLVYSMWNACESKS